MPHRHRGNRANEIRLISPTFLAKYVQITSQFYTSGNLYQLDLRIGKFKQSKHYGN